MNPGVLNPRADLEREFQPPHTPEITAKSMSKHPTEIRREETKAADWLEFSPSGFHMADFQRNFQCSWLAGDPIQAEPWLTFKIFGYPGTPQIFFEKKIQKFPSHKPLHSPLPSTLDHTPMLNPARTTIEETISDEPPRPGEEAWVPLPP